MPAGNRFNFTIPKIRAVTCPQGKQQAFFWDASTPNLGLRVTAAGSKCFIFQSRVHGKVLRISIGDPGAWPLGKAQERARHLQTQCDNDIDPRQVKKDLAAEAQELKDQQVRAAVTLGDLWDAYIEDRRHVWGDRHLQDHHKVAQLGGEPRKRGKGLLKPGPLAVLLGVRVCDLTAERIEAWLDAENRSRATSTALAFRLLKGFVSWCQEQPQYVGLLPQNALKARRVIERVHKPVKKEEDCLQRTQLPRWFEAVRAYPNPVISAYLQALILTGARREELAGLLWEDVDFEWSKMSIRDKVEGKRTIPLTPYIAQLLQGLRFSELSVQSPWVFRSSTSACGHIVSPNIAHADIQKQAGLPTITLHGLRRSFATLSEWVEAPAGVVAQIMGHKPSAIAEKHYMKRPIDLLMQWHSKIEAWILVEAGVLASDDTTEDSSEELA